MISKRATGGGALEGAHIQRARRRDARHRGSPKSPTAPAKGPFDAMATASLTLESVIGFEGKVRGGLVLHPDGRTMCYPLGATIVVKELGETYSQSFCRATTRFPPRHQPRRAHAGER